MTWSKGDTKDSKYMKVASSPDTYAVPQYFDYVSINVRNATATFKESYYQKHIGTNATLTREMITVIFVTFKCNLQLIDTDHVTEHYSNVHGIDGGASALIPHQEIEVNTTLPFKVPDLTKIKEVGPYKKSQIITSFFTQCVARGVISKTGNRNESCLNESRSRESMEEVARSSSPTFFGRFRMYLKDETKKDVDEGFRCKWKNIESSLYNAVGRKQNIARIYGFIDKKASDFQPAPLELLIDQVEDHENAVIGKDITVHIDAKNRKHLAKSALVVFSIYWQNFHA